MKKTAYKILGVGENASQREIKSARNELAKRYHADLTNNLGNPDKMTEINEAYSKIKTIEDRTKYDHQIMKGALVPEKDGRGYFERKRDKAQNDLNKEHNQRLKIISELWNAQRMV